jgi:hypothetical protein
MSIYIGIDPDIDKSGVAYKNGDDLQLMNLKFFDLLEYFEKIQREKGESEKLLVVVEAGWLNSGNWHKKDKGSAALNAKIGQRTGANHEVGKKIVEMLEYIGIQYRLSRPTKSKVNTKTFYRITGVKVSNQEQRDACLLIWGLK